MNKIIVLLVCCGVLQVYSKNKEGNYIGHTLPHFRQKMEEVYDDDSTSQQTEDPNHIVTFLLQNLKEIFQEAYDDKILPNVTTNDLVYRKTIDEMNSFLLKTTISEIPVSLLQEENNLFESDFRPTLIAKSENLNEERSKMTETSFAITTNDDNIQQTETVIHSSYNTVSPDVANQKNLVYRLTIDDLHAFSFRPTISENFIKSLQEDEYNSFESDFRPTMPAASGKFNEKNRKIPKISSNEIYQEIETVAQSFTNQVVGLATEHYSKPKTSTSDYKNLLQYLYFSQILPGGNSSEKISYIDNHTFSYKTKKPFRTHFTYKSNTYPIDYWKSHKFYSFNHHNEIALNSTLLSAPVLYSTIKMEMENVTSKILFLGKQKEQRNMLFNITRQEEEFHPPVDHKNLQSCIMCDNVAVQYCHNPKNKLIPSSLCNTARSKCYSMHTPFGIVDRGCYSLDHNMSIYVCAGNLCNNLNHQSLPVMFKDKREWATNIYEMSHYKRLRQSLHKDMACLRCEYNISAQFGEVTAKGMDCLEGQISVLPTEFCNKNEVCAVKAIKSQGYIWRGCISFPLYNYYMTLCDGDLCNNEAVVSVYDMD